MAKTALQFRHNGRDVAIFVDGGTNLLVALRELIGDMTPKFGCGQGGCGACSVLIDGELHLSCLTLAESVTGRSVQTLDGIKTTIHVDTVSNQAIAGTDRVYFVRVDGDKMMMKSPGVIVPMTGATSVVEIDLVKAD